MTVTRLQPADLQRVLDDFAGHVRGVTHALVMSPDALPAAASASCGSLSDYWAALSTGQLSLARNTGDLWRLGPVQQVMTRYPGGNVLLSPAAGGGGLAVLTESDVPLPVIAAELRSFWSAWAA